MVFSNGTCILLVGRDFFRHLQSLGAGERLKESMNALLRLIRVVAGARKRRVKSGMKMMMGR